MYILCFTRAEDYLCNPSEGSTVHWQTLCSVVCYLDWSWDWALQARRGIFPGRSIEKTSDIKVARITRGKFRCMCSRNTKHSWASPITLSLKIIIFKMLYYCLLQKAILPSINVYWSPIMCQVLTVRNTWLKTTDMVLDLMTFCFPVWIRIIILCFNS